MCKILQPWGAQLIHALAGCDGRGRKYLAVAGGPQAVPGTGGGQGRFAFSLLSAAKFADIASANQGRVESGVEESLERAPIGCGIFSFSHACPLTGIHIYV